MGERGYKNYSCIKVLPVKHINWCYSFHLQKLVCLIPRDQKECYCERAPPPPPKPLGSLCKIEQSYPDFLAVISAQKERACSIPSDALLVSAIQASEKQPD